MEDSKVKLNVLGITFSQIQAGAYALILTEEKGARRVPIIIGTPEAQSIAIFLDGLHPPRPLTHDLFIAFMNQVNVSLKEIYIYKFVDGVFYSELIFVKDSGEKIKIDSRTSDAIALAVRTNTSIYTTEEIMEEAGIIMENEDITDSAEDALENQPVCKKHTSETGELSEDELKAALDEAISMEDYEKASQIRDQLNKKKA